MGNFLSSSARGTSPSPDALEVLLARIATVVVMAAGIAILLGWVCGIELLKKYEGRKKMTA